MSYDAHKNFAFSLVATAPSPASSGTSLVVTAGQGANFPAVSFNAVVCPAGSLPTPANAEVVRVTAISTDTFTIARAQEGSSARTIVVGDQIFAAVTAKTLTDIEVPLGLLDLSTATAGQIKFPAAQNPSANANTLDDYEEGTWTPTVSGSTSGSGQTYSIQNGYYIKIGKFVWVNFGIGVTLKGTITGSVQIQGLPFTIENLANNFGFGLVQFNGLATNWVSVFAIGISNGTALTLRGSTAASTTNATDLVTADAANGMSFFGSLCYRASA